MEPIENRGFVGKRKEIEVNNLEDGYKGKDRNYESYQKPPPKSPISIFQNPPS